MDSTISHDPFAPDDATGGAAEPTDFRESRFRAVGATEEEIASYREAHDELTPEEQANNNVIIDEADDAQMLAWLEEARAEDAELPAEASEDGPESPGVVEPKAAGGSRARSGAGNRSGTTRKRSARST